MSLVQRALQFTFSGATPGAPFSVSGLRAAVTIETFTGRMGVQAQVKVWGLTLAQMNNYSSVISGGVGTDQYRLIVEAADVGKPLSKVIDGAIWRSFIDLSAIPDSCFCVSVAGIYNGAEPIESQVQPNPGPQPAEQLIASICAAAGLTLDNSAGAHAILRNHVTTGSALDQIDDIARAAQFNWFLNGEIVQIWPDNGNIDNSVINAGPNTEPAMIGYPQWWEAGIIVTTLFNQQVYVGRQMNVISSIPKAQGLWQIVQVQHTLTTMFDKGPWFTTAILSKNS